MKRLELSISFPVFFFTHLMYSPFFTVLFLNSKEFQNFGCLRELNPGLLAYVVAHRALAR